MIDLITQKETVLTLETLIQRLKNDLSNEWEISYDDLGDAPYNIDADDNNITIHNFGLSNDRLNESDYFQSQAYLNLIEALRMARHIEWLDDCLNRYHPETIIHIGRICAADIQTQKIALAYDLKTESFDSLWKHILCSDMCDMAMAYEKALEAFLSSGIGYNQSTKKSMAIIFNRWFANDNRTYQCDYHTLQLIDDMINDQIYFECKKLESHAIPCMTLMIGDDHSYLHHSLCDDIMKNPYYRAINDPINAAYFAQIVGDMNKTHIGGLSFHDSALAERFLS